MQDKYHIRYIEGCTPQTKSFKTLAQLNKFIKSLIKKHGSLDDRGDNWVDFIFKGNPHDWRNMINAKVLHRSALFSVAHGHTFLGVI